MAASAPANLTHDLTQRTNGGVEMEHKSTGWLSEKEVSQVEPAEKLGFGSPVPTQIVSNGEYNPLPQTEKQRQVEGLINEFADKYGKRQGMDRRTFLRSA